jgi:uncharacterized protein YegP (UPF0339 family)
MNKLNHLDVFTRSDGRYDFRIIAAENGETLCSSDQGYENRSQAVEIGKRALNADGHIATDPVVTFDARPDSFTGDTR